MWSAQAGTGYGERKWRHSAYRCGVSELWIAERSGGKERGTRWKECRPLGAPELD